MTPIKTGTILWLGMGLSISGLAQTAVPPQDDSTVSEPRQGEPPSDRPAVQPGRPGETDATEPKTEPAQPGARMTGHLVKADDVLGAKVFNESSEQLGQIEDVMFDENKGAIAYGILAIGGWLGIGEDLVAVPWKHLKQADGAQNFVVSLEKDKLQKAQRFTKDNWPNFSDDWNETAFSKFDLKADAFKGVKLVRASKVTGAELWNEQGNKIGEIEELLIHPSSGKVAYGVLDIGSWANMGDKLASVPWGLVRQSEAASPGYVLKVDKAKLDDSTFFDRNNWPNYNDPDWNAKAYGHFDSPYFWTDPVRY